MHARSHCLNCDAPAGEGAFCAGCGQRARHDRLAWRDLARDFNEQLVEGNLPWPRTLWRLTVDPGGTARAYVDGRRARHVHPLKYAFYAVLVVTLLTQALGLGVFPDDIAAGLPAWRRVLVENLPVYLLLLSPLAVLTLRVLFWRNPVNSVEIWVFVLYLTGHLSLLFLVVELLTIAGPSGVLFALLSIALLLYLSYAIARFFRARHDWSLVAGLVTLGVTTSAGLAGYFRLLGVVD